MDLLLAFSERTLLQAKELIFSYTCKLFKINTIQTLLTRAYSLCSKFNKLQEEFNFLRNLFVKNRFPRYLFVKILIGFLETKMNPPQHYRNFHQHHALVHTVNKKQVYIKLSYSGNMSFVFRKQLKWLLESNYNHISFKFIFTNNFRIRNLFSYKDHIVDKLKSRVIYEYTCSSCNARYIGSTERHFFSRIQEHLGNSIYTFRPLTNPSFSAIRSHSQEKDHVVSCKNFKIIDTAIDGQTLLLKESMYIKKRQPNLNNSGTSKALYLV